MFVGVWTHQKIWRKCDENRAELWLEKADFLGILGNLGSVKLSSGIEHGNRGFGIIIAWKTRQNARKTRENEQVSPEPSHSFYRGAEPPRYAGRTRVRSAYWDVIAYALRMGEHRGVGATWTIRGPWFEYAGRTRVRRAYSGPICWLPFGYYQEFIFKFIFILNKLLKFISPSYELRFRRSLYPREGETTIYNFRLDSVGKLWNYFYYLFYKMTWLRNFFKNS